MFHFDFYQLAVGNKGFSLFFNNYLAAPWPALGHSQGDSLANLMLITAGFFLTILTQRFPGAL